MVKRSEIRPLTGLRGIAADAVVAYRYSLLNFHPDSPLKPCCVAVDLFLILSGFVMTAVHARDFAEGWSAPGLFRLPAQTFRPSLSASTSSPPWRRSR